MIQYTKGNLLESEAAALVNTVNTVGVMGKGIALQFKNAFPENYSIYRKVCNAGGLSIGQMLVTECADLFGNRKTIINFPTKTTWRKPSEYSYIEQGLQALRSEITSRHITSVAIPPLGSRNGGLDWSRVRPMIEAALGDLDCDVIIYEPSDVIIDKLNAEKVHLTPARAMLLDVICDLVVYGEFASEFAAEKIVYFLQRFGAQDTFGLTFNRAYYGPYSGKVKYVLRYLNGSYLMGLGSMDQKPFDELWILPNTKDDAVAFLKTAKPEYSGCADRVKEFLRGYYSNYSLELLATVDYILMTDGTMKNWYAQDFIDVRTRVTQDIAEWSARKERMFNKPEYIDTMMRHLLEWHEMGLLEY